MLRQSRRALSAFAAALFLSATPVIAAQDASPTAEIVGVSSLDPGEYVWRPQLATDGPVEIVVSLPLQMAYVYRGGTLIGASTVSSGKPGHETPTGSFEILQKRREHFSNLYDNAPMPFMQRLTWDGIALHAGAIPGEPASHGCVRLPMAFARQLYAVTSLGATVHIVDTAPTPLEAATMLASAPARTQLASGDE